MSDGCETDNRTKKYMKHRNVGKTFSKPELLELSRWLLTSESPSLAVRAPPQQWASAAQNQFPQVVLFPLFSPEVCSALIEEAKHMERELGEEDPQFKMAVKQGGLNLLGIEGVRRHLASPLADFLSPLLWQLFPSHTMLMPSIKGKCKNKDTSKAKEKAQSALVDVVDMRVVRYSADERESSYHPLHIDQGATLTLNVCLGPATSICRGADLFFLDPMTGQCVLRLSSPLSFASTKANERKKEKEKEKEQEKGREREREEDEHNEGELLNIGCAVLHVADLPNGTTNTQEGERFHLIIRMKPSVQAKAFRKFSHLGNELQSYVLSFLTAEELLCARAICRHWRELIEDNPSLWRRHLPEQTRDLGKQQEKKNKLEKHEKEGRVKKKHYVKKEKNEKKANWAGRYIAFVQEQRKTKAAADSPSFGSWQNLSSKERRAKVIEELIMTEASYVNALESVVQLYLKPLQEGTEERRKTTKKIKTKKALLPADLLRNIFGDVEQVLGLHRDLYRELLLAQETCHVCPGLRERGAEPDIPSAFERFISLLEPLYVPYCVSYMHVREHLQSATQKYPKFAEFIRQQEEKDDRRLELQSYLVMPVSRLPRYALLLRELFRYYHKFAGEEDEEEETLRRCTKVQALLQHVEQICNIINAEIHRSQQ
ncbi:hypothetical protein QOT17_005695 [Balamuthia mandrillaris]